MLGGGEVLLSPAEWVWPGSAARMPVSPNSIWKVRPRAAPGLRRTWGVPGGERAKMGNGVTSARRVHWKTTHVARRRTWVLVGQLH